MGFLRGTSIMDAMLTPHSEPRLLGTQGEKKDLQSDRDAGLRRTEGLGVWNVGLRCGFGSKIFGPILWLGWVVYVERSYGQSSL